MTTICSKCGSSLAADVRFCPQCGTPTFPYYANSDASLYEPTARATPFKTPSQIPSTEYGSDPYGVPLESLHEPLNPYESRLRPPLPPPRRNFSIPMIALIVGLILLLIIAGGVIYYTAVFLPNRPQAQSTATAFTNVPTPSPVPFTYTNEAASSTNTLIGSAIVSSCPACSGGLKVGYVGNNDGALQFNNVNVPSTGTYTLTIYYCSAETRDAFMSIDGGSGTQLIFSSTGGWYTPGPLTVSVKLDTGSNTIKFYNPSGWAPDFDRIIVTTP